MDRCCAEACLVQLLYRLATLDGAHSPRPSAGSSFSLSPEGKFGVCMQLLGQSKILYADHQFVAQHFVLQPVVFTNSINS